MAQGALRSAEVELGREGPEGDPTVAGARRRVRPGENRYATDAARVVASGDGGGDRRRGLGLFRRIHASGPEPGRERLLLAVVQEHAVDAAEEGREEVAAGRSRAGGEQAVTEHNAARPAVDDARLRPTDAGALEQR